MEIGNRANLHVTSNTTLRDLADFTKAAGGDKMIRARDNKDGTVTLYAKDAARSSGFSKLFGIAGRRRERAQNAISTILERHGNAAAQNVRNGWDAKGVSSIFNTVFRSQVIMDDSSTMRGKALDTLAKSALALFGESTLDYQQKGSGFLEKMIGREDKQQLTSHIAQEFLKSGGLQTEALFKDLASGLESFFLGHNDKGQTSPMDVSTHAHHLKSDIVAGLANDLRKMTESVVVPSEQLKSLTDLTEKAVNSFVDKLLGIKTTDGEIKLNGESYELSKNLGAGAFGQVDLYKQHTDSETEPKLLAVKTEKHLKAETDPNFKQGKLEDEFARHKAVQGDGHENIIALKGGQRTESGDMQIMLELAPNGDLDKLARNMGLSDNPGNLAPELRKSTALTAMRDVFAGLQHMHNRGFVHGDLKLANVFIGEGGAMKIADFGTVQRGDFVAVLSDQIQQPLSMSPEYARASLQIDNVKSGPYGAYKLGVEEFLQKLYGEDEGGLKEGGLYMQNILLGNDKNHDENLELAPHLFERADLFVEDYQQARVGKEIDIWAAGTMLYQLMTGKTLVPTAFMIQGTKKLLDYPESGKPAIGPNGFFGPSTGDDQIDSLLNELLAADPKDRPTVDDILNRDIFGKINGSLQGSREQLLVVVQKEGDYSEEVERLEKTDVNLFN